MLISRYRRVQLFQNNLDTAATVHKAPDVVHHGGLTVHAGALVRGSELHPYKNKIRNKYKNIIMTRSNKGVLIFCCSIRTSALTNFVIV